MNKQRKALVRAAACVGAAFAVVLSAGNIDSRIPGTVDISAGTGLAGISLSADDYYTEAVTEEISSSVVTDVKESEMPADNVESPESLEISDAQVPEDAEEPEQAEVPKTEDMIDVSQFENVGISIADNYVYIRKKPTVESKAVGKLYRGCTAEIVEYCGKWVKIVSGDVSGYIKKEFLDIGIGVEDMVEEYGTKYAVVNTTTLKVREEPSVDSLCITMIPIEAEYKVLKVVDNGWVKILINGTEDDYNEDSTKGYVSAQYVDLNVKFKKAVSIKEERREQRRKERAEQAEREQQEWLERQRQEQSEQQEPEPSSGGNSSEGNSGGNNSGNNSGGNSSGGNKSDGNKSDGNKSDNDDNKVQNPTGATGDQIASYAQSFLGCSYSYGGTSASTGFDCSGLCYRAFADFGITIPRDSRSQAASGKAVDMDELMPGDIILYASGGYINHAALYIGGGQVIQASDPTSGVILSPYNYRTPYCARRYW